MKTKIQSKVLAAGIILAALANSSSARAGALTIGPDYKKPETTVPGTYQAAGRLLESNEAAFDHVPKGRWWEVFLGTAKHSTNSSPRPPKPTRS